jgi:methylated-DNA-[protein]-cysteine S-methyltransferase
MRADGFAVFDTAIGPCGIAWGPAGIVGVQLPESSGSSSAGEDSGGTGERMARRFPSAAASAGSEPPPFVAAAIEVIRALLRGEEADLSGIQLDFDAVTPFRREVYELARQIPPGTTSSYGEIANRLGKPGAARAVGQAMGNNPFPIVVPCHRVLAAGGKIGGFSADGGTTTKARMLAIEGAILAAEAGADTEAAGHPPR